MTATFNRVALVSSQLHSYCLGAQLDESLMTLGVWPIERSKCRVSSFKLLRHLQIPSAKQKELLELFELSKEQRPYEIVFIPKLKRLVLVAT